MALDSLEVAALTLEDFGIPVRVTPLDGSPGYDVTALVGSVTRETALGQQRGHVATHRFRVLPSEALNLVEGDMLTPTGAGDYAVHEVVPVPGKLTRVMAVER
jgi:hypothetical protein